MKLKTLFLAVVAVAALNVTCMAQSISVSLNGDIIEFPNQQPVIVEGRTLIPLRGVFDNMGYEIRWEGSTKTVTMTKGSDEIVIHVGESCYYLNGESNEIDVPAQIINGSTMLPLRAIADAGGCQVLWDDNTKIATIIDLESYDSEVMQGTVYSVTQQENDYIESYSEIMAEFNASVVEFMDYCNEINNNGFESEEQLVKLNDMAGKAYDAAINAKNKVSALSSPDKYAQLHNITIEYMQVIADVAQIYTDFLDGNIDVDAFLEKINTVGTEALMKENEYRKAFESVVDN